MVRIVPPLSRNLRSCGIVAAAVILPRRPRYSSGIFCSGAPPLSGLGLESLAQKYQEVQSIVRRWARRYDERFLEQLLYVPRLTPGSFDRIDTLRDWCRHLETRLNSLDDVSRRYRVAVGTLPAGGHRIDLQRLEHGLSSEKHIPREFFESAEYQRIAKAGWALSQHTIRHEEIERYLKIMEQVAAQTPVSSRCARCPRG